VRTFLALLNMELRERRIVILIVPVILIVLCVTVTIYQSLDHYYNPSFCDVDGNWGDHCNPGYSKPGLAVWLIEWFYDPDGDAMTIPMALLLMSMFIASSGYAIFSLFYERENHSILFWKSMPVSDAATVITKFICITVIVPIFYFGAALLLLLPLLGMIAALPWIDPGAISGWSTSGFLDVILRVFLCMIGSSLWLAPVWAFLMLSAAMPGKFPGLLVFLSVTAIFSFESLVLRTSYIDEMLLAKLITIYLAGVKIIFAKTLGLDAHLNLTLEFFAHSHFWIGFLLLTPAFLAGAIYLRRYRDAS